MMSSNEASALKPSAIARRASKRLGQSATIRITISSGSRRMRAATAGPAVAARIRREPDEMVMRIVADWPRRFDARRAIALGFKAEASFDDIIRIHIEDEM